MGQAYKKTFQTEELNFPGMNLKADDKYSIIFQLCGSAVFIFSADREILDANTAACRLYEYKHDELRGMSIEKLFYRGLLPDTLSPAPGSFSHEETAVQVCSIKKDGTEFISEATVKFFEENNSRKYFLFINKVENKVSAVKKEKEDESAKEKSAFLSRISHDLRTPLIGITGYAKILSEELTDPELKTMSEVILESGKRLNELLGLILDLSVVESEKIKNLNNAINLSPIVIKIAESFESAAEKKGLKLKIDIDSSYIPAFVDEVYYIKILNNLLSNAVKYTNEGEVRLELKSKVIDNQTFSITNIIDSGIGLKKEELEKLENTGDNGSFRFKEFPEGTLGLEVTRRLIKLMKGNLIVKSQPGKGSVFTIVFPSVTLKENSFETPVKQDTGTKPVPREVPEVLIVEDDSVTIEIMKIFLKGICSTDSTSSGEEAVAMTGRKNYAAILMDINLKGMSGLEAAKRIKTNPHYKKVPIVAVTAYAMIGDKERLLAEGCTHYISKPFFKKNLTDLVKQVLQKQES